MSCVSEGRIVISVVCYRNDDEVVDFARQIEKQDAANRIVLLVTVNKANDYNELSCKLASVKLECHLYNANKNLGYLNGSLYGVDQYGKLNSCDKVVISNTDLTLKNEKTFSDILMNMEDDDIWCLGPSIQLITGKYQNPFLKERPSNRKIKIWKIVQGNVILLWLYTYLSKIKNRMKKKDFADESGFVYSVHGSFFVLNQKCVLELAKISSQIFMYGEELLVAEIVRANKHKVFYNSQISITHNENSTTSLANMTLKADWYNKSFRFIVQKFFKD